MVKSSADTVSWTSSEGDSAVPVPLPDSTSVRCAQSSAWLKAEAETGTDFVSCLDYSFIQGQGSLRPSSSLMCFLPFNNDSYKVKRERCITSQPVRAVEEQSFTSENCYSKYWGVCIQLTSVYFSVSLFLN